MSHPNPTHVLLPHPAPTNANARLLLFAIRRMAAGGLADAYAAHAFFTAFGSAYRRPLLLLRALMVELCRVASTRLTVAPCCSGRLSADEQAMMKIFAVAAACPEIAHARLCATLHVRTCLAALSGMQAVAASFADEGRALNGDTYDCVGRNYDKPFNSCDGASPT